MEKTLPKRKNTRLKNYNYCNDGAYFITICTKEKQKILCDIVVGDGLTAPYLSVLRTSPLHRRGVFLDVPKTHLSKIGEIVNKYILSSNNIPQITVDKYVIMPNHIHLIFVVENSGTSWAPSPTNNIISHTVGALKRFVNNEIGYNVFQRSFHDHIIRGDKDYLKICSYIDSNPSKWQSDCFYIE